MRNRKVMQPAMIGFINELNDPELNQIKPYLKFINQWSDKHFLGVYEIILEKIKEELKRSPFMLRQMGLKATYHYDNTIIRSANPGRLIWKSTTE